MTIMTEGIVMGLVATAAMDLWGLLLNRLAGLPLSNWGRAGRWVVQVAQGRVFHDDIGAVAPMPREVQIGWAFHYAVGVIYGVALAVLMGPGWLAEPTFLPAWVFSIVMIGFGWFLMQPAMGAGIAASKTPAPWRARALGLAAHTVFGAGLWVGAMV
ncbi:DUF2938 domain-containing protein [Roseobacter sp. OBYS 0001]|uniref:DUF2938 domain-containing protein n=1 Tax=Roseobacter sp. OBYS 0001 TaxID=882651 RepID=UPI001C7FCB82|nr:DUF2938 domain-containing protein [Roseobacter sp. OBYS 0001]